MSLFEESFEGLSASADSPRSSEQPNFLKPGALGVFAFSSGVNLVQPAPNLGSVNTALLGDFTLGDPTWGLGKYGSVDDVGDVPDGNAYIGRNMALGGTLGFGFNTSVYTVGALVDSADSITIAAYAADGSLISGASMTAVRIARWDHNYLQVISAMPIAKVVFTGGFLIVDKLSLDSDPPKEVIGTKRNDTIDRHHSVGGEQTTDARDLVLGKGGADKIHGLGGADTLEGGSGRDKLYGDDGNDVLIGQRGNDELFGGRGQDTYLFRDLGGTDQLKDFNHRSDAILLDHVKFATLAVGPLAESQFQEAHAALEWDDRIIDDDGKLYYDDDGNGPIKQVLFAVLSSDKGLSVADFLVV